MNSLRLAIVCPPISGHLNPALALGRELKDRGHQVALAGFLDAESKARAAGLEFLSVATTTVPLGWTTAAMKRQGELSGLAAMRYILKVILSENLAYLADLSQVFAEAKIQALVLDQLAYGAASVAAHLGLPYVTMCNALAIHPHASVPPINLHWPHSKSRLGQWRNRLGYWPMSTASRPFLAPINRQRRAWGLPPISAWNLAESRLAQVSQQPACFEFPGRVLPDCFHFTGPWHRVETRSTQGFPFEKLDGRPLIYASMGTLQNRLFHVFEIIAEACLGLNAQLVMSLGAEATAVDRRFAGDPIVVPFAPQLELLRRASLVITHAGLNTTLETLSAGLPMVAIPVANDQPGIASRIRHLGVGEFVPLKKLTAPRLRAAIDQVWQNSRYQDQARGLQASIASANGLANAAEIIEQALRSGQPVLPPRAAV